MRDGRRSPTTNLSNRVMTDISPLRRRVRYVIWGAVISMVLCFLIFNLSVRIAHKSGTRVGIPCGLAPLYFLEKPLLERGYWAPVQRLPFHYVVFAVYGAGIGLGLSFVVRKHSGPGMCARCGYDMRATPDACPECGWRPS